MLMEEAETTVGGKKHEKPSWEKEGGGQALEKSTGRVKANRTHRQTYTEGGLVLTAGA